MNLDNRVANKVRNKARKQQLAKDELEEARAAGPGVLAATIFVGNQYVRSVIEGRFLAGDVTRFQLTAEEQQALAVVEKTYERLRDRFVRPTTVEKVAGMLRLAAAAEELKKSLGAAVVAELEALREREVQA